MHFLCSLIGNEPNTGFREHALVLNLHQLCCTWVWEVLNDSTACRSCWLYVSLVVLRTAYRCHMMLKSWWHLSCACSESLPNAREVSRKLATRRAHAGHLWMVCEWVRVWVNEHITTQLSLRRSLWAIASYIFSGIFFTCRRIYARWNAFRWSL